MKAGYIKFYRQLLDSKVFDMKDPLYLKMFVYFLLKANHRVHKGVERGQLRTSYRKIASDLKLLQEGAPYKPVKDKIYRILSWFKTETMVSTVVSTPHLYITILNYEKYQGYDKPDTDSDTDSDTDETHFSPYYINKKKEDSGAQSHKNEKSKNTDEPFYKTKKKKLLRGKWLTAFEKFWEVFDYKRGKASAADAWIETVVSELKGLKEDDQRKRATRIIRAARKTAAARQGLINRGGTPKMAQGWISDRRWEDEEFDLPEKQETARPQPKQQTKEEFYEEQLGPNWKEILNERNSS